MQLRSLPGACAQLERLRTHWRLPDGMLGTLYRGQECLDATPLVADLGDTAPFLAALGEREEALTLARAACPHLRGGLFRRHERAYLFDNHDLVLGWLELYEQTGEAWLLERSREALHAVQDECEVAGRLVDWAGGKKHAWRSSSFNAGFIEVAVDLHRATRDPTYLAWAQRWAQHFVRARSFQRHGLWSRFDTPRIELLGALLGRLARRGPWRMFKDNTNCVWGLLALQLEAPESQIARAITRFVAVVSALFRRHGHVPQFALRHPVFDLSANVFIVDLLADIAHFTGDTAALALASSIAASLEQRRWGNGLLPRGGGQAGDHLDIMTDYGVALYKLHALGAGEHHRELAEQGWNATWQRHQSEHGLVLSVDGAGHVVDDRVFVKYQFLATKALLVGASTNVYAEPRLWRLLRDR
ncbi:MAG: hypothetical protein RL033_6111 [Pseudomonadota bacterium]